MRNDKDALFMIWLINYARLNIVLTHRKDENALSPSGKFHDLGINFYESTSPSYAKRT